MLANNLEFFIEQVKHLLVVFNLLSLLFGLFILVKGVRDKQVISFGFVEQVENQLRWYFGVSFALGR